MTEESVKPSKALTYFEERIKAVMPPAEAEKFSAYQPRIALTTTLGDFHRCVHCADWANALEGSTRDQHHRQLLRDVSSWERCLGALRPGKKISDVELGWVDDAVRAAQAVATSSGWGAVHWQELVEDLIGFDGIAIDDSTTDRQIPDGWTCLLGILSPQSAATYAAVLADKGIVVTKRTNPRQSGWNDRQYPEELLVRSDQAQEAHDVLLEWSKGKPTE